jgi:hypothetical protein
MVNRRLGDSCSTVRAYYGARVRGPKPRTGSKVPWSVERTGHSTRCLATWYSSNRSVFKPYVLMAQNIIKGASSQRYIPQVTSKFYECATRWPARDACTTSLNIFHKSRRHLKILGVRNVACSKFYTEDPQFWSCPWTSLYLELSALSMWTGRFLHCQTKIKRPEIVSTQQESNIGDIHVTYNCGVLGPLFCRAIFFLNKFCSESWGV